MDVKVRNALARTQRMERLKGVWCGPVQKKILLLLLGGLTLSCARSPRQQWRIIKGVRENWKEITKQAAERAVAALYDSKLLKAEENSDGTITLVLTENGRKRALTHHIRYARIKPQGAWDSKWRIVLYDIPEDAREARDAFRDHLTHLGVRKLQRSAGIFPFDCKEEVEFFIELLNIRKYVRFIVAYSIDDEAHWRRVFKLDRPV